MKDTEKRGCDLSISLSVYLSRGLEMMSELKDFELPWSHRVRTRKKERRDPLFPDSI